MKKVIYCLVAATLLAVMFLGCAKQAPAPTSAPTTAPVKPVEIKVASFQPATVPQSVDVLLPWAKMVEERTGGRVKFVFYWGESLVKGADAYDACISRVADMVHNPHSYNPGRFPLSDAGALPSFGFPDSKSATAVLLGLYEKFPEIRAEYKQVKLLWLYADVSMQLQSMRPVRTLEDLKGMKVRTPGSYAPYWTALGATPVSVPGGEIYTSLQKGIVDANAQALIPFFSYKLDEVIKYITMIYLLNPGFLEVMNLDTWNSLPSDVQKKIDELSGTWASLELSAKAMDKNEAQNLEKAKTIAGLQITYLSEAERARWLEVCRTKAVDKWVADMEAKGLPGKKIIDEVVRLSAKQK